MPKNRTGAPSLRLGGSKTNALAVTKKRNEPNALAIEDGAKGSSALERFQERGALSGAKIAKFKGAGDVEIKKRAREQAMETFERRVDELVDEMDDGQFRLRLLIVLDYTASTIEDVTLFVSEIRTLVAKLQRDFVQINFLPIATSGPIQDSEPVVHVGEVGDLDFYDTVKNELYKWQSPVGAGVIRATQDEFFGGPKTKAKKQVNAVVAISDEYYEIFPAHNTVMQRLKQAGVAVASLTSGGAQSHVSALSILGELGIVVDRSRSEMDPVSLIREFIINQKRNILRAAAVKLVREKMQGEKTKIDFSKVGKSIGLGEHLKMKGFAGEAKNVIQGGRRPAGELTT